MSNKDDLAPITEFNTILSHIQLVREKLSAVPRELYPTISNHFKDNDVLKFLELPQIDNTRNEN